MMYNVWIDFRENGIIMYDVVYTRCIGINMLCNSRDGKNK